MLGRKKKPDPVLNWHPNFRIVETLPDIKQVRTGFVVNFAAIFIAVLVLGWTVYTEVQIHNVNHEIDRLQGQMDGNSAANKKGIAATKNFVAQSKSLQFAAHFYAQRLSPMELITALVDARPDNIYFDSIEISSGGMEAATSKNGVSQRIIISGTMTSNSELPLDDYVNKILASPSLKGRIGDPNKDRKIDPRRDSVAGVFKFTITLTLKPVP